MNEYVEWLEEVFSSHANAHIAEGQKAYMRNKFEFYGLKSPVRKGLQKKLLVKTALPDKEDLHAIIKAFWDKPQREFQYFAMDLAKKYTRHFSEEDIQLFEYMVTQNSWWDTVDFIASHLMGSYFLKYPNLREGYVKKWLASGNFWLQRSALLFQLKYKDELDTDLLERTIEPLLGSSVFFINKAIGWVLREYSKTNPGWVLQYANKTNLQPLSRKEALRIIQK
ncbi:MAG: DNA alkylation repair protein [Flavobacteriaceae bacterium]|nr:DNA alkylation repair protein [Flavobacteriaceae bacterium]